MKIKITLIIITLLLGTGLALYFWSRSGRLQSAVVRQVSQRIVTGQAEANLLQKILGFDQPQTYLILFLNNTELRPAGGFIGAYAVVRTDKGVPKILKVEGTELLDNLAPQDFPSVPPEPLQKYLGIKRWGFRDSNWSPNFASSSEKALDLFKKEKGVAADDVSAVIGITPTLLEEILKISGPITVNGEEFNAKNFTEKLEYEVEFGYAAKGLDFDNRKKALVDLTHALLARLRGDVLKHWPQYLALGQRMLDEKHILAYAQQTEAQTVLLAKNWAGIMRPTDGDYILWVDANLAALKTDKVMERELSYSFAPVTTTKPSEVGTSSGKYIGTVKMKYINNGTFTKFTTRYRTYARVFLPLGSRFISVSDSLPPPTGGVPPVAGKTDQGVENGKQWFGAFTSIEPGKTGELVWQFYLAPQIVEQIRNNSYSLLAQKQAGTIAHTLTLDLNFGKNIASAGPSELGADLGNQIYNYNEASGKSACDLSQANCNYMSTYNLKTDLRVDREFKVNLH